MVTRGRSGGMALNGCHVEVPAEPVEVVDTLGAGDALIAAVIAARIRGQEIGQALEAGGAAAARRMQALRRMGADMITTRSERMYEQAGKNLVGGVGSGTRSPRSGWLPHRCSCAPARAPG